MHKIAAVLVSLTLCSAANSYTRQEEVLLAWQLYFEDWGIYKPSPRRVKRFPEFAEYVVKWTEHFENNDTNKWGKTFRLPDFKDNHLLVAVIITKETGVKHKIVGKARGEVGLMQVHGWKTAQDYHHRREIRNDPELGIKLGIQWLAYHTTLCKKPKGPWKLRDWLKPVSIYGTGPRGKCKVCSFARIRVNTVKRYRVEIDRRHKHERR